MQNNGNVLDDLVFTSNMHILLIWFVIDILEELNNIQGYILTTGTKKNGLKNWSFNMFCDVNLQLVELKFLPSATHNYFFVHSNALIFSL